MSGSQDRNDFYSVNPTHAESSASPPFVQAESSKAKNARKQPAEFAIQERVDVGLMKVEKVEITSTAIEVTPKRKEFPIRQSAPLPSQKDPINLKIIQPNQSNNLQSS
jgi:hypothetical protein